MLSQYNIRKKIKTQKTHTNKFTFTYLGFSRIKLDKKKKVKFRSNIFFLCISHVTKMIIVLL